MIQYAEMGDGLSTYINIYQSLTGNLIYSHRVNADSQNSMIFGNEFIA
jgi:hypothetical protein